MKTISQLIITMMICLFSIQTWAQSGKLFNTDNQLSSNLATQVFQDKSGFIWIATRNGLNNYDGYHITVIKKDMSNFLGLNSNYINSIAQDEKEHILLGTNNSLLEFTGSEFLNPYARFQRQRTRHLRKADISAKKQRRSRGYIGLWHHAQKAG